MFVSRWGCFQLTFFSVSRSRPFFPSCFLVAVPRLVASAIGVLLSDSWIVCYSSLIRGLLVLLSAIAILLLVPVTIVTLTLFVIKSYISSESCSNIIVLLVFLISFVLALYYIVTARSTTSTTHSNHILKTIPIFLVTRILAILRCYSALLVKHIRHARLFFQIVFDVSLEVKI